MDRREIEDLIIGLLAEDAGRNPAEVREALEDLGEWLPVDSVIAAEVLTRVEAAYGVSLPATAETSKCLGSVTTFAQAILELVESSQAGTVETA